MWGSTECEDVPANAVRFVNGTDFVCAPSFYRYYPDFSGLPVCQSCVPNSQKSSGNLSLLLSELHMLSAAYAPETCTFEAFDCQLGYYRSRSIPARYFGGGSCVLCPNISHAIPFSSSALNPEEEETKTVQAALSRCGVYPCQDPVQERNAACPPSATGCLPGFYYTRPADGLCTRCRTGCSVIGQIVQPCTGGQRVDPCIACKTPLQIGQIWQALDSCATVCTVGFRRLNNNNNTTACTACAPGKYQSDLRSNASECTKCAPGTYARSQQASVCASCPVGTFNDGQSQAAAQ